MKRLIRLSGYVIDNENEHLRDVLKLATGKDARHWHVEMSDPFDNDFSIQDKNCDLEHLERHFVNRKYRNPVNRQLPRKGEKWKHFKGKTVTVVGIAKFSEDPSNEFVVYQCPSGMYARPVDMFMSEVDRLKYPNAEQTYRFECIGRECKELVNHPAHYNAPGRKECIEEMIDKWGREQTAIWCEMTAYKYDYRAGTKEGEPDERDMAKRQWYLDKAVELHAEPHENRPVSAFATEGEITPSDVERTAPTWQEKLMKAFLKGAGK